MKLPDTIAFGRVITDRELISRPKEETPEQTAERIKKKLPRPYVSYVVGRMVHRD